MSDLVRPEGLEPPAYWFEASRSIQLSYGRMEESNHCSARDAAERYGRIRVCVGRFSGALACQVFLRAGSSIGRAADS